ncbi:hypothetical protein ACIBD9_14680 [Micromonospora sp. NPDC050784]|uniref:hypothetical protein n=1 Tax=Micromonospora sp. NPDC050784 TaxID=3364281 RepID=UPI0037968DF5
MSETALRVWGRTIRLTGFTGGELAEVFDTFGGSIDVVTDGGKPELTLHRQHGVADGAGERRSRHRGGSPAGKYFLDGTPFDGAEQRRDITIVSEGPGCGVYAEDRALLVVAGDTATIVADTLPPMLVSDVIEDWLLCRSRADDAVQVHCAGWLDDGHVTLAVGSSGAGKSTELFRNVRSGSSFFSNDRAFLRLRDGALEVRSFPLPVNIGCGTIRSLDLPIPHHDLGDHDKIRLRAPEVAERFDVDYETWYPVARIVCTSLADFHANIYWDEDDCHPFWIRSWHPGALPGAVAEELTTAIEPLITERNLLTR